VKFLDVEVQHHLLNLESGIPLPLHLCSYITKLTFIILVSHYCSDHPMVCVLCFPLLCQYTLCTHQTLYIP
jgi:hypothetical protein